MDKYLNHDYARKLNASDVNINENGTWYIPHHAVVHPKKKSARSLPLRRKTSWKES